MKNFFKKISPNILLLSLVSGINDISSEMVNPILPLFIKSLGGTGIAIGIIGGLRDSIDSILRVVFGYASDKIGKRKIFVANGYLISVIFRTCLIFSNTWKSVLVFIGFERVGKAMRTAPRDAIVADYSTEKRGLGFGVIRTFNTMGAIVGSFFAFFLFWVFKFDFKSIILASAIFGFISILPLYFLKEQKRIKKQNGLTIKIGFRNLSSKLKTFIVISAIFYLSNFSYMFMILKAQKAFSGKFAVGVPILLYVLFNIFYASFSIPFGMLADKIGRKKIISLGYFLFSMTFLGFALFDTAVAFVILFALYGTGSAMIEVNQRAYTSDLSSKNMRGSALGLLHATVSFVALISSLIAGILWENISPATPFFYGGILSLFASILLLKNKQLP